MGDEQERKPAVPELEVPDLELEPVRPPARVSGEGRPAKLAGPDSFAVDDGFLVGSSSIELGGDAAQSKAPNIGLSVELDLIGDFELEGTTTNLSTSLEHEAPRRVAVAPTSSASNFAWPRAEPLDREQLAIDALELRLLAAYGEAPASAYHAPAYAYRVFTRQRELKRLLAIAQSECDRAEAERDSTLAELGRATRPDAERNEQFRRLISPLVELEQTTSVRSQALSSVNAELTAQAQALDTELGKLGEHISGELAQERAAQRAYDDHVATAQRAEAKLKRVHIEIRALTQVAEQKLGPQGGKLPEPEATQLAALRQRAEATKPEVEQTNAALQNAKAQLERAVARVGAARQTERRAQRKKEALVQHYRQQLDVRARGLSESEQAQRAALVALGRAVLTARGVVPVPELWLERARGAAVRADALALRAEMLLRALDAYDRARVAQGVRLACTCAAIVVFLLVLKVTL